MGLRRTHARTCEGYPLISHALRRGIAWEGVSGLLASVDQALTELDEMDDHPDAVLSIREILDEGLLDELTMIAHLRKVHWLQR